MQINPKLIKGRKIDYILRCPKDNDGSELSKLRVKIDSETEYLDREPGEGYLSEKDFKEIIKNDLGDERSIFLIAEVDKKIVGFARCIGKKLERFRHQAEFGICITKDYWGYGIGKELLKSIIALSEEIGIEKITLSVVETNIKAIDLYTSLGFIKEGLLVKDRIHKDGNYYNTVIMARFNC